MYYFIKMYECRYVIIYNQVLLITARRDSRKSEYNFTPYPTITGEGPLINTKSIPNPINFPLKPPVVKRQHVTAPLRSTNVPLNLISLPKPVPSINKTPSMMHTTESNLSPARALVASTTTSPIRDNELVNSVPI